MSKMRKSALVAALILILCGIVLCTAAVVIGVRDGASTAQVENRTEDFFDRLEEHIENEIDRVL